MILLEEFLTHREGLLSVFEGFDILALTIADFSDIVQAFGYIRVIGRFLVHLLKNC